MGLIDLFKPKWKHSNSTVRQNVVKNPNFTNQAILAEIAKNDKEKYVREAAVEKLADQALLADVAKNGKDEDVRSTAVEKLTDEDLLTDVAKNGGFVGEAAVKNINDQDFLTYVAENGEDGIVRIAAVKKLIDQSVLADIAKHDKDKAVRRAADEKLEVCEVEKKKEMKERKAQSERIPKLNDARELDQLLMKHPDHSVKAAAALRLGEIGALAFEDRAPNPRYKKDFPWVEALHMLPERERTIVLGTLLFQENVNTTTFAYMLFGMELVNAALGTPGVPGLALGVGRKSSPKPRDIVLVAEGTSGVNEKRGKITGADLGSFLVSFDDGSTSTIPWKKLVEACAEGAVIIDKPYLEWGWYD